MYRTYLAAKTIESQAPFFDSSRLSESENLSSVETISTLSEPSATTISHLPETEPSETSDVRAIEKLSSEINGSQAPEAHSSRSLTQTLSVEDMKELIHRTQEFLNALMLLN